MTLKYDVFIRGNVVDLVALTEDIVLHSDWYKWFNDETITANMQQHYFPNTSQSQLDYYRSEIAGNQKKLQLGILYKEKEKIIGMISLSNIDSIHRKAELAIIIGDAQYQKLPIVLEANHLILRHGFQELNLRKIYGGTIIKDLADMYVRVLGFQHEGIRRQEVFKSGKYHDLYLIGVLREEFYDK